MNENGLDHILERCLQELARTGDIEGSLRRCPEQADQLRPLLELAQMVERGYEYEDVPEALGGLAAGRERLLDAAAQRRARTNPAAAVAPAAQRTWGLGRLLRLPLATRLVGVLLALVVGIGALGGGIAWAAAGSLPGETLYPVKMAVEDVRWALTATPDEHAQLALRLVEERVGEIQALVEQGEAVPDEPLMRMEHHMAEALMHVAWTADDEMPGVLRRITRTTRTQAQSLDQTRAEVSAQASEETLAALERAAAICRQGEAAAAAGLSDPQTFRWQYRHPSGTPGFVTLTPGLGDEPPMNQERHQWRDQERTTTPAGTPHATPQGTPQEPAGPQMTIGPRATPSGPLATPGPHTTPQGQATPGPNMTPQGPQSTPGPHTTPAGPGPRNTSAPSRSQSQSQPQSQSPSQGMDPHPQATSTTQRGP